MNNHINNLKIDILSNMRVSNFCLKTITNCQVW